MTANTNSA